MAQERFEFIKAYTNNAGTIPVGTQVDIVNGVLYTNGYLCDEYSRGLLSYILNSPKLKQEYLKKVVIPYNKV